MLKTTNISNILIEWFCDAVFYCICESIKTNRISISY